MKPKYLLNAVVLCAVPMAAVFMVGPGRANAAKAPTTMKIKMHTVGGTVSAFDADKATITLTPNKGDAVALTIATDAKIEVDGKAAALADIKVDMKGNARVAADGTTAVALTLADKGYKPPRRAYNGAVMNIDTVANTVTLQHKNGQNMVVKLDGATKLQIDGKPGTLADVKVGMDGRARLAEDGQTATELMVTAQAPAAPPAPAKNPG